MRSFLRFTLAVAAVAALLPPDPSFGAAAQRRTALVIGNADYENSPLANPANDARAMAAALRDLGFEVIERIDVDQAGMKRAIWDFGKKLRDGGVGLFYFAGHGVQVHGENYLIPIRARIEQEPDVEIEAVRVTRVMAEMDKANNGMNIVILDACRNNPFARSFRSATRGLAQMRAPVGTLLAYATAPGSVAADGDGENGLYTSELLRAIKSPGLKVEDVFKRVRGHVREKSDGRQVPWESTSIEGDFYFVPPRTAKAAPTAPTSGSKPLPVTRQTLDTVFWQSIEDSKNAADYRAYLNRFPEGTFAELAKIRLRNLEQMASLPARPSSRTGRESDIEELERTFVAVTRSNMREDPTTASAVVGTLAPGTTVTVTGKVKSANWYRVAGRDGGNAFVFGDLLAPVEPAVLNDWQRIGDSDDADALRDFLKRHAESPLGEVARLRLAEAERASRPEPPATPASAESEAEPAKPPQVAVGVFPEPMSPGRSFKDCEGCPEMVVVPAGRFVMGAPASERHRTRHEGPQRAVTIRSFAIGKYEVTFDEWYQCVNAGGCEQRPKDEGWGGGRRPVIGVSWNDVQQYVQWLSQKTGQEYRLPSEAEWEYAARAGTATTYPWGDDIGRNRANCNLCGSRWDRKQTAPVGSFKPNALGLHDMIGNVWEWVDDCWNDTYQGAPTTGAPWLNGQCSQRVLRGGSWMDPAQSLRSAARLRYFIGSRFNFFGFRVAKTLVQ